MDDDGINIEGTIGRFERLENKRFKRGDFGATAEFMALAREPVDRLAKYIPERLHRQTQLNLLLRDLDPHELALVTVASLMHSALVGREDPEMTLDLGRAVQGLAFETKVCRDPTECMGRTKALAAMETGYRSEEWSVGDVTQAGNRLLDFCLRALPDWFELRSETALAAALDKAQGVVREKRAKAVVVPEEKQDLAVRLREQVMWAHPVLIPCKSSPKPWTGFRDGGYQEERTRPSVAFVTGAAANHKETRRAIEAAFIDGSIKPHADAVNALQSVPLKINARLLDAVGEHYPDLLEEKFRKNERDLKDKKEKMAAAGASDKAMYWITGQIKKCQDQFRQDRKTLEEDLALAEYFKGGPFHLPLCCDFRGRVLPVPPFHFQRADHIRSLFLFERGLRLGDNIKYLKDLTASRWGEGWDKKTFPERREWCDNNWDLIESTARLESDDWLKRKKPFAFLAACIELNGARKDGADFMTHLPIFFDGACNGLQHFCALTRSDPLGMMEDHATATPAVDAYNLFVGQLETNLAGKPQFRHIEPTRDLVKGPVSTYFYGASNPTMADQIEEVLIAAGVELPDDPTEARKLVLELAGEVRKAIEDRILGARETMQFLRKLAGALAKQNEALQGPTPSGFPWANRYDDFETTIIASELLGLRVRRKLATDYKPDISAHDARNAAVPNFIHGLDAAHLARTVNACAAAGIRDLITIHDCYGVMAPQAEQFNKIVREEFVRMYEEHDPLTEIRDCALRSLRTGNDLRAKGQRVTKVVNFEKPGWCAVPDRGDLDLRKFLNTPYAFAP